MDKFTAHEAMDRAHLIADIFDKHLRLHPFIAGQPELANRAEQIADQLGALYQAIGQISDKPKE
jgi:hypothetical protein